MNASVICCFSILWTSSGQFGACIPLGTILFKCLSCFALQLWQERPLRYSLLLRSEKAYCHCESPGGLVRDASSFVLWYVVAPVQSERSTELVVGCMPSV